MKVKKVKIREVKIKTSSCKEKDCNGKVGVLCPVSLALNSGGTRFLAYPCDKCGRLHQKDESLLFDKKGRSVFWDEKWRQCVLRNTDGSLAGVFGDAYSV